MNVARKNLECMLYNSIGSKMFRNYYMLNQEGIVVDVLEDGDLSCAAYLSSMLYLHKLIGGVHGRVESTMSDIKSSGWIQIEEAEAKSCDVLVWEEQVLSRAGHRHIGVYLGDGRAVSSVSRHKTPQEHGWKKDGRGIESVWRHPSLHR